MKKVLKVTVTILIKVWKYNWLATVMAFAFILSACTGGAVAEPTQDVNIVFTQVAETVMVSMTQTAGADIDFISTQVAATMYAEITQEVAENIIPTSEPTIALEPASEITFICEECINDDGSILAISLWQHPNPDNLPPGGYVYHGDKCLLLDEATDNAGIDRVLLDCPGGKGWVRKEGISYGW